MIEISPNCARQASASRLRQDGIRYPLRAASRLAISSLILVLMCSQFGDAQSADQRLASAKAAIVAGKYQEAEAEYRALLREVPDSPEYLTGLGVALHSEGKSSEAIVQFEHSLRERKSPLTLTMLGVDDCRLGYMDRARAILKEAKRYFSDNAVLQGLGPCYLDAGEPLDAIQVYQTLLDRNVPPEDENAVNLARAYLKASNYFVTRLRRLPGNRSYLDAIKNAQAGTAPNARRAFPEAMMKAPFLRSVTTVQQLADLLPTHQNSAPLFYFLGVICGEQAIATVTTVEHDFPDSTSVHRLRAEIFASQDAVDEARNEYETMLKASAGSAGLYHDAAMFYRGLGDWNRALELFKLEGSIAPDDERATVGITDCLLQLGNYASAEQVLQPIVQKGVPPEWALTAFASTEQHLEKLDTAVRLFEAAEKQNPSNPALHYHLMTLYRKMGKSESARKEAQLFRFWSKNREHPVAHQVRTDAH